MQKCKLKVSFDRPNNYCHLLNQGSLLTFIESPAKTKQKHKNAFVLSIDFFTSTDEKNDNKTSINKGIYKYNLYASI